MTSVWDEKIYLSFLCNFSSLECGGLGFEHETEFHCKIARASKCVVLTAFPKVEIMLTSD